MARRGEVEYIVWQQLDEEEEVIFSSSDNDTCNSDDTNTATTSNSDTSTDSTTTKNRINEIGESQSPSPSQSIYQYSDNSNSNLLNSTMLSNSMSTMSTIKNNASNNLNNFNNSADDNSADDNNNENYELQDFDFRLLGDENIVNFSKDQLVDFYKKDREFELFPNININDHGINIKNIRLLSWNILADGVTYAMSDRHDYVPREYREWNYRNIRIFTSILAYEPDIITLQEVTGKMYTNFIKHSFESVGFNTLHISRPEDSVQSETLLYKRNRFVLLQYKTIHLGELSNDFDETYFGPTNNMFRNFLKSKHDHGVFAKFKDLHTNLQFIVCCAHLFWDPERSHIKSAQMFMFNEYLIDLMINNHEWRIPNVNYNESNKELILSQIPIIFSCDSNSVPCKVSTYGNDLFVRSGVNEIMYNNKLNTKHLEHPITQYKLRYIRNNNNNSEFNPHLVQQQIKLLENVKSWKLSYPIHWRSVYNEFYKLKYNNNNNDNNCGQQIENCNEIIFTNKVPHFADTIDYIYVNKPIQLISILTMPYEKKIISENINQSATENVQISCYDYPRYLQERHLSFDEFINTFYQSIDNILQCKLRFNDQLLFVGYIHQFILCNYTLKLQFNSPLIRILMIYYYSEKQLYDIVAKHDEFICDQSFWRMIYASHKNNTHNPIAFNAWNYPLMPNRKDPSDHFALCCDFAIGST